MIYISYSDNRREQYFSISNIPKVIEDISSQIYTNSSGENYKSYWGRLPQSGGNNISHWEKVPPSRENSISHWENVLPSRAKNNLCWGRLPQSRGTNNPHWGNNPQRGPNNNSHDLRFVRLSIEDYQHNFLFCEVDLVNNQKEIANHSILLD